MIRFKNGFVICLLAGVLLLSACGAPGANNTDATKTSSNGEQSAGPSDEQLIYKKKCISCHGVDLQGRAGPSLQNVGSRLTEEEIFDIVANGRKGMPKFEKRLSEEEIHNLSRWLSEMK
ncbi:cytochrome c-550 [Paenibacillus radicis (ex Gao et al. 2016)]|uniref:Cytochrome c-550 n=2 Tax=Paenibacillus radicis (ex Gao et al. 2016) TaxID=1737354 RepID=A0A917HQK0_9BACL|nr:cytochrome c-550 [Paenibacillus radicis (ex Gao et al. 2016)]